MNQKPISQKLSRIVILAVASLIFWVYLGSIINFHQHHIFGRNLMPQGILAKREESVFAAANLQAFPLLQSDDFSDAAGLLQEPAEITLFSDYGSSQEITIKSGLPVFHSLRGPPLV